MSPGLSIHVEPECEGEGSEGRCPLVVHQRKGGQAAARQNQIGRDSEVRLRSVTLSREQIQRIALPIFQAEPAQINVLIG